MKIVPEAFIEALTFYRGTKEHVAAKENLQTAIERPRLPHAAS